MRELIGRTVTAEEVQNLHLEKANEWFLLEVIEADEQGRARTLRVVKHSPDKDVLREYILEDDKGEGKKYIFYFSDLNHPCELD